MAAATATSAFVQYFGAAQVAGPIEWRGGSGFRSRSCSFLTTEANMKIRLFLIPLITSSALLCAADRKNTGAGAESFNQIYVGCHGPDGKSQTDMGKQVHAADLTSTAIQKLTDSSLSRVVENGKREDAAFPGQTEQRRNQIGSRLCSATSQEVRVPRKEIVHFSRRSPARRPPRLSSPSPPLCCEPAIRPDQSLPCEFVDAVVRGGAAAANPRRDVRAKSHLSLALAAARASL
jgi:hypothetical protein